MTIQDVENSLRADFGTKQQQELAAFEATVSEDAKTKFKDVVASLATEVEQIKATLEAKTAELTTAQSQIPTEEATDTIPEASEPVQG
jgi:Tfp pilus assembly protein FimV